MQAVIFGIALSQGGGAAVRDLREAGESLLITFLVLNIKLVSF